VAVADELLLKIKADSAQASAELNKFADKGEKSAKRVADAMHNAGKKMTTAVTLPLVGAGVAAVKLFTTQEDATAKLTSAFESTGASAWTSVEALQANADALQQLTTHGDETIEAMQSVLLTFTNVKGDVFNDASLAVLNMSDALGMDLQSAAVMAGKALNDPVAGISAMSRAGIQFTEDQKATIKALAEGGDVAGAQAIILKELETQFGGTAETMAQTSSGQMKQAMNTLGDSMETVGAIIIPILTKVTDWIGKVAKKFDSLSPEMQKTIVGVAAVVAAIGPVLMIGSKLISVIGLVGKAMSFLAANPVVLIIAAVAALVVGIVLLVKNWDKVTAWIRSTAQKFFDWFGEKWDALKDALGGLWDGVVSGFKGAFNSILSFLASGINKAIDLINGAISAYNKVPLAPDIGLIKHVTPPRIAEGGMTTNAGPVKVGERGPEILNLPAGSSVVPLTGMGNGGVNVTIERLEGGDPKALAHEIGWELAKRGAA
jgi:hypothetical protein